MVDQHDEDDLFKPTSMTFGEHLEELRSSLFKAVVALAIGFGIVPHNLQAGYDRIISQLGV